MKNNGGSVFPLINSEPGDYGSVLYAMQNTGLTVRDYFAGQALTALCTNRRYEDKTDVNVIAEFAYLIADTMIAEREKES